MDIITHVFDQDNCLANWGCTVFDQDTFTDGLFGLGPAYQDSCGTDNDCMAMLSLQVLILMLAKPFPKFLKDIILP